MESRVITRLIANLEVVAGIRAGQKITTLYNDLNIDTSSAWTQMLSRPLHGDTKEKTIDAITIVIENAVLLYDLLTELQSSCAPRIEHRVKLLRILTECPAGLRTMKATYPDTTSCNKINKLIDKIMTHTQHE